eukprot:366273-Chlamydomonas_euryale.AAC.4
MSRSVEAGGNWSRRRATGGAGTELMKGGAGEEQQAAKSNGRGWHRADERGSRRRATGGAGTELVKGGAGEKQRAELAQSW